MKLNYLIYHFLSEMKEMWSLEQEVWIQQSEISLNVQFITSKHNAKLHSHSYHSVSENTWRKVSIDRQNSVKFKTPLQEIVTQSVFKDQIIQLEQSFFSK